MHLFRIILLTCLGGFSLSHTLAQRAFCGLRWCNAPQDSTACMLLVDPALQYVDMESSLRQRAELS